MKKKPPYNLRTRLTSAIRKVFMWHPGLKAVRDRTRTARGYQCESCHDFFPGRDMRCDHIEPVVPISGFDDWNSYIDRMFSVIPDGMQHLCKSCHGAKTKREMAERVLYRRKAKSLLGGAA